MSTYDIETHFQRDLALTSPSRVNHEHFRFGTQLLQTLYAVMIVLAFQELAAGFYEFFFEKVSLDYRQIGVLPFEWLVFPVTLVVFAVMALGVRMFWGVVNVERAIDARKGVGKEPHAAAVIGSVGVLLVQALLIYILSRQAHRLVLDMRVNALAHPFALVVSALLLLNGLWLRFLVRYADTSLPKEAFWAKNNLVFAVGIAIASVACAVFGLSDYATLCVCSVLALANSVIDVAGTAGYYFGFDTNRPDERSRPAFAPPPVGSLPSEPIYAPVTSLTSSHEAALAHPRFGEARDREPEDTNDIRLEQPGLKAALSIEPLGREHGIEHVGHGQAATTASAQPARQGSEDAKIVEHEPADSEKNPPPHQAPAKEDAPRYPLANLASAGPAQQAPESPHEIGPAEQDPETLQPGPEKDRA